MMLKSRPILAAVLLSCLWGGLVWEVTAHCQSIGAKPADALRYDGLPYMPLMPLSSAWQRRIQASADNPRLARQVILDSIYANRTLEVGLAYQKLYLQKPNSQVRIANFGHTMAIASLFYQQRENVLIGPYTQAIKATKAIVMPEMELPPDEQPTAALKKTKVADAWLAWGIFNIQLTMDHKSTNEIYKHALELDPTLQEANYWRAHMAIDPVDGIYLKAHKEEALRQLNEAEAAEPKLHPLAVDDRANLAISSWDYKTAIPYLQEYLRSWPTSPYKGIIVKLIAQLKAAEAAPRVAAPK